VLSDVLRPADQVPAFEVRLLGPVQAVRAGKQLALGGPMQRAILAMLLVEAGRVVPAGRMIEQLWRGRPPGGASITLRAYVSRLRRVLEPEALLSAQADGYILSLAPQQLDSAEFERLAGAGQAAASAGMAAMAADRFGQALRLWRGEAFAGVAEADMLMLAARRLEELRLTALEGRVDAELALNRHGELVGELEQLVARYPVRERFWCQLVLALYWGGRQSDALAACRRARAMLSHELGLEPGPELDSLEDAVLRHEVPRPPAPLRHNLPAALTSFLGRGPDIAAVSLMLARARMVTLTGPGGVGKTRLAIESATRMVEDYRDGVWMADLAGIARPDLVAVQVMAALGVRQSGDVPVLEALRFRLRGADLLLVLDNCEHMLEACAELAAELLRAAPQLRVLTTSRETLGIPGEVAFPVPPLKVPPEGAGEQALADSPAVRLFLERAPAARSRVAEPMEMVARICRSLDGLPLAIELAAARASVLSVPEIQARLADRFRFLAYRRPVPGSRHQALKAAIDWSYELLSETEARVFRELSVFAGSFSLAQVAAVCCDADEAAALDLVDRLTAKSMVVTETAAGVTRYRLLETLRQYAAELLADSGEARLVRKRHAVVFADVARRQPSDTVLAREQDNFRAALDWSLGSNAGLGDATGPQLALALGEFWRGHGYFQEAQHWLERALDTHIADARLRAWLHWLLGAVRYQSGDLDRARALLAAGSLLASAAGEEALRARIQVLLAEIGFLQGATGGAALAEIENAAAILESEGDLFGLAEAWVNVSLVRLNVGDVIGSQHAAEQASRVAKASGNRYVELVASDMLIGNFGELPVPVDVAIGRAEQLLQMAAGEPWAEVHGMDGLAFLYACAGRLTDARALITRTRSVYMQSGDKLFWAGAAPAAGKIEMMAGNYAAAEELLAEARDVLQAMGERGFLSGVMALLAETTSAQGRFSEALRLTEETETIADSGDVSAQIQWRATRAKVLARLGQPSAASQLASEALALVSATSFRFMLADVLSARADIAGLAGELNEAEASLRAALRIYEEGMVVTLAERARAALARLTAQTSRSGPGSLEHIEDLGPSIN